jgi:DNA-binding NtrC family response regulator
MSIKKERIAQALKKTGGNIAAAGRQLGLNRDTLTKQIQKLGLSEYVAKLRYFAATGQNNSDCHPDNGKDS